MGRTKDSIIHRSQLQSCFAQSLRSRKMLSIGLVLAFGSITGALACDNTTLPDGTTCPPNGLHTYVDPDHCSKYWECYNGCLNHMTCQNDYLFDPVHGWCDFPQNICCGDRDCDGRNCNDVQGGCGNDDDKFDCPEANGFFPDPEYCAKYWQCNNDIATHHTCDKKNGEQLLYRPSDVQCDWKERVECDDRLVCDDNWENCHSNHITTPRPSVCEGIPCDHGDGFYPEGDCAQCFCRCVGGAHYETCCAPGLAFNPAVEQCDWPANINGCQ